MGDAKRRKQTDPFFGIRPKSMAQRGLVVCPPIEIDGSRLYARSSNLDPLELRFSLLYWDKLVWPTSNIIHFESSADEKFLEQEGVLSRPRYVFNGDGAQGVAKAQIQAFLDREREQPGAWALAQGESSLLLKDSHLLNDVFQSEGGALVRLHRAIPIPTRDVPLAEVLEFKNRRKDELLALRHHLDCLSKEIATAESYSDALKKSIADVDASCSDLMRVGKEWQSPVHISDINFSLSISFGDLIKGATGLFMTPQEINLQSLSTVLVTAASIVIKPDIKLRSPRRPPSPYRYAYYAHTELL